MTDSATITCAVVGLGACTNPNHIPVPSPVGSSAWIAVQAGGLVPGKGEREGMSLRATSPCFHELALQQSPLSDILYKLKWTKWPNASSPSQSLSYIFLCVSSCFSLTEKHSPNIFILTNLAALLWIFPSIVLQSASHDWVIRVAHSVLEKRVTVIYIRALQYLW